VSLARARSRIRPGQSEPVAVKILRPDRLGALADWKTRWAEQAELLHFIRHPGVVGIREHFEGNLAIVTGAEDFRGRDQIDHMVSNMAAFVR